jgi:DNA-binding LacI/PurR family transcriptional regulator
MNRPTIKDVAARAGIGKSTVSRVLRGSSRVSPETRETVLRAMDELGYRPNAAARTLVQHRSHTIGVLVTDLHSLFYPEVLDGIDAVAEEHGYTVLVVSGKRRARAEEAALRKLLELRVDGIVCVASKLGRQALLEASRATPVAILTPTPRLPRVDCVRNDDYAGATLVVEHLTALGHRRITMIDGTEERAGVERRRGYEEAMAAAGLGSEIRVVPGGYTERGGYGAAQLLLAGDDPPSAIFAANDDAALGVLNAVDEAGLDVPGDISVVGYDNTSVAALGHISLTTVHQPRTEIGAATMRAVLDRIERPKRPARRIVIPPVLVPRATSGPVPQEMPPDRRRRARRPARTATNAKPSSRAVGS